jgi:hypothetical protein
VLGYLIQKLDESVVEFSGNFDRILAMLTEQVRIQPSSIKLAMFQLCGCREIRKKRYLDSSLSVWTTTTSTLTWPNTGVDHKAHSQLPTFGGSHDR